MKLSISIAICTIHPRKAVKLLKSLENDVKDDEVLVIVDGPQYNSNELKSFCSPKRFKVIINKKNNGLSYCRNLAIDLCENQKLVFFDDDVILKKNVIKLYKKYFLKRINILGGPLLLPHSYPYFPKWIPEGLSSLLGIHINQEKIWGGNFGFDVILARKHQLRFQTNLGRIGKQLQCGDDTTFINSYCKFTQSSPAFCRDLAVEHFISLSRYKLKYLVRRAFWQGRSEIRRNSFFSGFKKEFNRSFNQRNVDFVYKFIRFFSGIILFTSYLAGCCYEIIF